MRRTSKRIFSGFLWGMALGGLLTVFLVSLLLAEDLYDYRDSFDGVRLLPVDAIVCLAGGKGRIAAAGDLWLRYFLESQTARTSPPTLYISGMGPASNYASFQTQIRQPVLEHLKPDHVFLEIDSDNTLENATVLADQIRVRGWKRIVLVTSPYHMKRAQWVTSEVFRRYRLKVEIETYSIYHEPFAAKIWRLSFQGIRVTVEEYIKWVYYYRIWPRFWNPEARVLQ